MGGRVVGPRRLLSFDTRVDRDYKRLKRGTHTFRVHAIGEADNAGGDGKQTFRSRRR
jgi:hypothetical protein